MNCDACRRSLAEHADTAALRRVKAGIDAHVASPAPHLVERMVRWLGLSEADARLTVILVGGQMTWLLASLSTALVLASLALAGPSPFGFAAFLIMAPLVPTVGVALAFGPRVDPGYELVLASPTPGLRVVLFRTIAACGLAVAVLVPLSLLLPGHSAMAFAWLLPALGLALAAVALGSVWRLTSAAFILASGWVIVAVVTVNRDPHTSAEAVVRSLAAFRPGGQVLFALVIAVSLLVIGVRRTSYEVAR
jgi:hypothetical protein